MEQLVKTLINGLHGCKTVLDVGVGTGRFAKPLKDGGFKVVGVDIAKPMIAEASERGVDILVRGDSCFLPFKDNVFDAAVCIYLLHLISEWKTALWEICRVTRKAMVTIIYVGRGPF